MLNSDRLCRLAFYAAAAILLLLIVYGVAANNLMRQPIWSPAGLRALAVFSASYWILAFLLRRRFLPVALAAAVVYAAMSAGPLAVLATVWVMAASAGLGLRLLPSGGIPAVALGLGLYAFLAGLLAHFPINTWVLYLVLTAAGVAAGAGLFRNLLRSLPGLPARGPGWIALPLFLAWIHLLAALFPEAGSDGLGLHLTVPAWVKAHGSWPFDPSVFSWSLMPMNGDWAFTIAYLLGGEPAPRLLNLVELLLIAGLVYSLTLRIASHRAAMLAAAMFLSTPVSYLVTGSLFVENFWTLVAIAALALTVEDKGAPELIAAGVLAGCALSAKLLAAPLLLAVAMGRMFASPKKRTSRTTLTIALVAAALFAAPPYIEAWVRTGNPVFPNFNTVFRSPLFNTDSPAADPRYPSALRWDLLWDATFHSATYLEGYHGSLGFHYLLLLPLSILLLRRDSPRVMWLCLAAALFLVAVTFAQMGYLRYVFPAFALLAVVFGWTLADSGRRNTHAGPALAVITAALVLMNTYFLAAASSYTRDFALPLIGGASAKQAFLERAAPVRALVEHCNRTAPGDPVAFFEEDQVAGLIGRPYTASWRTWPFLHALDQAKSPADVSQLLRQRGITHAIGPSPGAWFAAPHAAAQGLLRVCGRVEQTTGNFAAWTLPGNCPAADDSRYFNDAPAAPPGDYDDAGVYPRYYGHWIHDRQFALASGHTLTYSQDHAAYAQLRFNGTRVRVVYTAAANRGVAEVTLDGIQAAPLDQRSEETRWQSSSTYEAASAGIHTLRIHHNGAKKTHIDIDRFLVE